MSILSCFCVIFPVLCISCKYQHPSQLSYNTQSKPQALLRISVMSLSRFGFLKASGVFLWLFFSCFFIKQVFLLSAFLQVIVRAPQVPGVLLVPNFLSNLSSGSVSVVSRQQLVNPTSTKFGKSTEIAKMLPSCNCCENELFNRGGRCCIFTLSARKARLASGLTFRVFHQAQPRRLRGSVESPKEVGGKQEGNWKYGD